MPTSRGNPDDILRALADPERVAIAGVLARAERTADELAAELDLDPRRVMAQLGKLTAAGVAAVAEDRRTYHLDVSTLRQAAEIVGPPRDAGLALGAATDDEEQVLKTFFRNGRLTEIPMKRSKRRIVLERVALEFEPGRRYDEKDGLRPSERGASRSREGRAAARGTRPRSRAARSGGARRGRSRADGSIGAAA